ncbi:MAG: acyl-ACP--UDP-N-acetylglucosamine O-acyltransferase [Alphaproteobacteria bacterium]|jgi:UDP-N-acetylglucosamine acyltransferase|nr:acyl-ACP--UDP-N-acetylglucosamine O-acyltransferase [Alphaproteobacteria bacterium]
MIHETAIVHPNAKLGADVKIGPNCIIGENVVLGDRVELISNVIIDGKTEIGDDSIVYPFAVLGVMSQDLKFQDAETMTGLRIGKRNRIREYATIHSGTPASSGTEIGDDCQIMVNAHIGHDCKLGNGIVLSNLVQIAGHVEIEDFAIVSACSAVHQFVRIGRNAFIGGMTGIGTDVVPYSIFEGRPGVYRTINKVGLMRHGFTNEDIHAIHAVYSAFFTKTAEEGSTASGRLKSVRKEVRNNKYAMDAIDFIENRSMRGVSAKQ